MQPETVERHAMHPALRQKRAPDTERRERLRGVRGVQGRIDDAQTRIGPGRFGGLTAMADRPVIIDEEVARDMVEGFGGVITELTSTQADYIGVTVEGPFKPETYRY